MNFDFFRWTHVLSVLGMVFCFPWLAGVAVAQDRERPWQSDWDTLEGVTGYEPGPVMDEVVPGEFVVDPPTLENLGFRWYIDGDSNRNATVEVFYRETGAAQWIETLPMLRVHHEVAGLQPGRFFRTGNLFAGSVLFLEPDTEYEVKFVMRDPDGGAPNKPKIMTAATRAEPVAPDDNRVLHVYPAGFEGARVESGAVFESLGDALAVAGAGDTVYLHTGVHSAVDAPYVIENGGTKEAPLVIRGAGAGETILEGPDHDTDLFQIPGADHLFFEDLTLRRAHTALHTAAHRSAGRHPYDRDGPGASWLTVRRCHFEDVINGIWTTSERSQNWYIADNVFTGTDEEWHPRTEPGRSAMDGAHTGVNLYGQGHVVCYNRISRFSDSLAIANMAVPSLDSTRQPVNIDFYNNDLSFAVDDTIEADYGAHNIRVYRNLNYNAHTALSVQPGYGGPIYLIRNVAYGITNLPWKLNNHPSGVVAYHNTTVGGGTAFPSPPWSNGHFRNNLFVGNGGKISTGTLTPERSSMDYNGYRGSNIRWFHGTPDRQTFETVEAFHAATGFEENGIEIEFDEFVKAAPVERGRTYETGEFDLQLRSGAKSIDAGVRLPGVNDGYSGEGPDLGAYESGREPTHYGPRPE